MESALTISPSSSRANRRARADLPLAVGPAISQTDSMHFALTLVSPDPEAVDPARSLVEQAVAGLGGHVKQTAYLGPNCIDKHVEGVARAALREAAEAAVAALPVDVCVQPWDGRRKRLLIADMDST